MKRDIGMSWLQLPLKINVNNKRKNKKKSRRTFIKSAAVTGMFAPFVISVFAVDNSNEKANRKILFTRMKKKTNTSNQ